MPSTDPFRFAILSDAHVHDIAADYGLPDAPEALSVRPLADTMRSTRVFNESKAALLRALEEIAARGIRHVVITGDYTDDGQGPARAAAQAIFCEAEERLGLRIFLTVGNHDVFADDGRHRTKRFLTASGGHGVLTSDPERRDPDARFVALRPDMRCLGSPAGLAPFATFGFMPREDDLLWETPFGTDPDPEARRYAVTSPDGQRREWLFDASYLVEPVAGLRFLMIDANVFVPLNPGQMLADMTFEDSTNAGWTALLRHKPFLLDWIGRAAETARRDGARLIAFSHYPVLDPLDGTGADERALLGETDMVKRRPSPEVAEALIAAGITVHVSGHLHVNDTAQGRNDAGVLTNIAMPALCGFPPAYKIATLRAEGLGIETVSLDAMPLDARLMRLYAREAVQDGLETGGLLEAGDYGAFLHAHIGRIATRRYLKRDWPQDLAEAIRLLTLGDLARLALTAEPVTLEDFLRTGGLAGAGVAEAGKAGLVDPSLSDLPATELVGDWYRLRMGSDLGLKAIAAERRTAYAALARAFAGRDWPENSLQRALALMMRMMTAYAEGLPSIDFTLDWDSGAIRRD
ncbi:hypothetical protein BJF92_02600 [Rhizobium rhizosphaerae]|uniref:Calcineurin-like phosphoesterase domain-containing protein n=1 Tax=Xaviernesmea rhizosphaerae TaxID=1672749 RepID=A0A1Q9AC68_9HYPH|nr:metallophosphoesterase [Xaviernesmea rhizosphaerae]OLP52486.1 hypothetical protein BJF92_02600 [Xaviernesmea rhizosphaerae]